MEMINRALSPEALAMARKLLAEPKPVDRDEMSRLRARERQERIGEAEERNRHERRKATALARSGR